MDLKFAAKGKKTKYLRILFFILLSFLLIHPAPAYIFRKIFIYADPLYQLSSWLYLKQVEEGILVVLVYILLIILFNNFFCRDICPVGFILERFSGRTYFHNRLKFSGYLFWGILLLSFFSINLVPWFDPFVFFTQASSAFSKQGLAFSSLMLIPLAVLSLLNIVEKRFWCKRLCPVGYFLNLIVSLKQMYRKKPEEKAMKEGFIEEMLSRRSLLFLLGCLSASFFYPKTVFKPLTIKRALRPPGSLAVGEFNNICLKCGACIKVCPTNALQPAYLEFGFSGIGTPLLKPKLGYCAQSCTKCGEVCPVQSITHLSEAQKSRVRIGLAKINKSSCLCHTSLKLCLICYESCPYQAIKVVKNEKNFPVPVVMKEKCVGCGKCENKCPVKEESAIRVYNL